jgi:hypothetical protein
MDMLKDLWHFIQTNPNTALVDANGLLVLATFILAAITFRYTSQTQKMAEVMAKDYELRVKPFIDADIKEDSPKPDYDCRWILTVENICDSKASIKNLKGESIISDGKIIETINAYEHIMTFEPGRKYVYGFDAHYGDIGAAIPGSTGTRFTLKFSFEYAGIDHNFITWEKELT